MTSVLPKNRLIRTLPSGNCWNWGTVFVSTSINPVCWWMPQLWLTAFISRLFNPGLPNYSQFISESKWVFLPNLKILPPGVFFYLELDFEIDRDVKKHTKSRDSCHEFVKSIPELPERGPQLYFHPKGTTASFSCAFLRVQQQTRASYWFRGRRQRSNREQAVLIKTSRLSGSVGHPAVI